MSTLTDLESDLKEYLKDIKNLKLTVATGEHSPYSVLAVKGKTVVEVNRNEPNAPAIAQEIREKLGD